jgi:hypothetical protein
MVSGRVAWAKVAAIVDQQVNYVVAVIFDQPLAELPGLPLAPGAFTSSDPLIEADPDVGTERDGASTDVPARSNLTQFPAARTPENAATPGASCEPAVSRPSITTGLRAAAESTEQASRDELETERRRWDEERSTLAQEAAHAVVSADALQAALKTAEQAHAQALADQQSRYEGLIAALLKTSNDQQAEYQQLLEERTAARDQQRTEAEARIRELQTRVEAAEALSAAHDARYRGLRQEAHKLLSLIASPLPADPSQQAEAAAASQVASGPAQAVA